MQEAIINLMTQYGYFAIFFLIFIENLFPPIPSEVILLFGGFMTTYAGLNPLLVIVAATFGSLLGAEVLYLIGNKLGIKGVTIFFTGRIGYNLGLKREDLQRTNSWFKKRGNWAVFLCRFVPLMRSLISIPAGIASMNKGIFYLLTLIGSLIWNCILTYLGILGGSNWEKYSDRISLFSDYFVKISATIFIVFIVYKLLNRKKYEDYLKGEREFQNKIHKTNEEEKND